MIDKIAQFFGASKKAHEPSAPSPDRIDKLTSLKALLDSGAINEAEFELEKQRLFSSS
ncbi:MAG: hypothetical protein COA99_16525 [Moraxellaceae bacterium]|nr:MAG: hypothetical protein COA99_16525 [Moraxellaceae bacterium]